jgi:hypothetical protein
MMINMLKTISSFLLRISKTWVMILTLGLMVLFLIFVLPGKAASSQDATGSSGSPDTSFFYQPARLAEWAEEFGAEGRQAYIYDRWTFDLIFPLVYVGFLAAGISWLVQRLAEFKQSIMIVNLLPITAGILDYLENTSISILMAIYPGEIPGLATLSAAFSALKWIFVFSAFLAYFILAAAALIQRLRPKKISG